MADPILGNPRAIVKIGAHRSVQRSFWIHESRIPARVEEQGRRRNGMVLHGGRIAETIGREQRRQSFAWWTLLNER